MKAELIKLGFYQKETANNWYYLDSEKFYIELCLDRLYAINGYFFIYTFMSGDRESAPHPFLGIDKLNILINAYKEYFK